MRNLTLPLAAPFLGLCLATVPQTTAAQENEDSAEVRPSATAQWNEPEHQGTCGMKRFLGLCRTDASRPPRASFHKRTSVAKAEYNKLQRLAGAIADKLEAGQVAGMKLRLKIILE